jgi:hypothetical protein
MSYTPNLTPAELAYRSTLLGPTDSVAGDDAKLWLPIWSGEVLHAYDEYKSFEPMVTAKSISSVERWNSPSPVPLTCSPHGPLVSTSSVAKTLPLVTSPSASTTVRWLLTSSSITSTS